MLLALAWFFGTAGLVLSAIAGFYLIVLHPQIWPAIETDDQSLISPTSEPAVPNAGQVSGVSTIVEFGDSRPTIVSNFLKRYDSPLRPYDDYGRLLVEIADRYHLDFRLLPAIAMQESNLCKTIPPGSHNCLGFGIHSQGTWGFNSYQASFERAAQEIKSKYIDIGLTTPQDIMTKYTPASDGSWAESVNQWMAEMRYDDRQLGRELKTNADVLEFIDTASGAAINDTDR